MKHILLLALLCASMVLYGCTSEKTVELPQKIPAIVLSPADKEKLLAFQKELLSIENVADKAVRLAGDELKNVIKGGTVSLDLPGIIDKAKAESLLAGESLAKKSVPEGLPPELKSHLNDGKSGLIAAYKAYAESFEAIKRFITEKNPMAILDYRKKYAEAQQLFTGATGKLKMVMAAAGVAP